MKKNLKAKYLKLLLSGLFLLGTMFLSACSQNKHIDYSIANEPAVSRDDQQSSENKNPINPNNQNSLNEPAENNPKPASSELDYLHLPDNFNLAVFAENLKNARVLKFDPQGILLVSLTSAGKIVALLDEDNNGKSEKTVTVLEGLNRPHGFLFDCQQEECKLYVAEAGQLNVYDYHELKASNKKKLLDLPQSGRHFTRTLHRISTGQGEKLLISIGSTCDVCEEKDERVGTVLIANLDGSEAKIFAKGLRNSVFLTTHPVTGEVWATEMGRDFLGNDLPPDEINILQENKHYGWPYCYGKNILDSQFKSSKQFDCSKDAAPSHINIPAHSAPLGLAFIPEEGWPEEYWHDLLVAYHGSWNKDQKTGYKIVRYKLDEKGNYESEKDFIYGWLQDEKALGRPVDIVAQPGGLLYISDDFAGKIYRVNIVN